MRSHYQMWAADLLTLPPFYSPELVAALTLLSIDMAMATLAIEHIHSPENA